MKALTIPASRPSTRELMRSISATVSNFVQRKTRHAQRPLMATAIASTVGLFVALGMQSFPDTVTCGVIALSATALAPIGKEGGIL